MRYLSLFSGIEAASVAWMPLGWECVGVAEIEQFPCKVLEHHYPSVPNLGDITKITKEQIESLGHIDLVVGGFPCQDLSVAGLRKGLKNEDGSATRSGLFYTAMRIARWAKPRWILLENVPGLYSSHKGADFAEVVREMGGSDDSPDVPRQGWGTEGVALGKEALVEWATLDAQWFGVAQRRRRVFALADFGNWFDRPPILLECQSLRGDIAPSREKGKEVAPTNRAGAANGGKGHGARSGDSKDELIVPVIAGARMVAFGGDVARTLQARHDSSPCADRGMDVIAYSHAVAFSTPAIGVIKEDDVSSCISRNTGGGGETQNPAFVLQSMQVRRLTPKECERLQGFPDDYTNTPKASDGARYKALGNSMAVPVMHWIGKRIKDAVTVQDLLTNLSP